MTSRAKPIPEGFHTATPSLTVRDAASAIAFYKKAFGATELRAGLTDPRGKVLHAEIQIGDSPIMLADEFPQFAALSPETLDGIIATHKEDVSPEEMQKRAAALYGQS